MEVTDNELIAFQAKKILTLEKKVAEIEDARSFWFDESIKCNAKIKELENKIAELGKNKELDKSPVIGNFNSDPKLM